MHGTLEYSAIQAFYGDRTAKRSGVRLMNHIDEGLAIMGKIGASHYAKAAFCLHPLFQADAELLTVGREYLLGVHFRTPDPYPIMLAMEYRQWANAWLSDKVTSDFAGRIYMTGVPDPGPITDVRHMLIADKVQNRKDFEQFHKATHKRSVELDRYFRRWLSVIGVAENNYKKLAKLVA